MLGETKNQFGVHFSACLIDQMVSQLTRCAVFCDFCREIQDTMYINGIMITSHKIRLIFLKIMTLAFDD